MGTHVRQQHGAIGPGKNAAEIDNADALERKGLMHGDSFRSDLRGIQRLVPID